MLPRHACEPPLRLPCWATLQDTTSPPCLLAAAATALLQFVLADTDGAWEMLSRGNASLEALLATLLQQSGQLSSADSGQGLPTTAAGWEQLRDALTAGTAAAQLLVALLQLMPPSQPALCSERILQRVLECCAVSAALATAVLPARVPPAAQGTQAAAWAALPTLANSAALLLLARDAWTEDALRAGASQGPAPLAVVLATAMASPGGSGVAEPCVRLLQAALARPGWAAALLQNATGGLTRQCAAAGPRCRLQCNAMP